MNISCLNTQERFCVRLLGKMNGYDSIQRNEGFCNQKPTKKYNFDDYLTIFREDKEIVS